MRMMCKMKVAAGEEGPTSITWESGLTHLTAQPLGSILEAKQLRQEQKAKILGRQSQGYSHLYSKLPAPSHGNNTYPLNHHYGHEDG
jgi:hypothetical protein